ncbi:MAG: dicarboxylate/amino acid:cation symporter [Leptospira sp.]|nr:dicarboxylate/amino acid:cation symporter [Leptospira sp.]
MKRIPFWLLILISFFLGSLTGICLHPEANVFTKITSDAILPWLKFPGDIFLNLLQMIMIPLVISSVALGVSSLENVSELLNLGTRTIAYFVSTTIIAVIIGISIASFVKPGSHIESSILPAIKSDIKVQKIEKDEAIPFIISEIIPKNIVRAFSEQKMLSLVLLGVILGIFFLSSNKMDSEPLRIFFKSLESFCIWTVSQIMKMAPFAVFGLMAYAVTQIGASLMIALLYYVACVIFGLLLLLCFYLIIVFILGKRNPFHFLASIREVQILGFSTSSSSSVLPISLTIAKTKLHIKEKVADFVLPLGATINMDGTALYQAVATIFISQIYQIEFTLPQLILLVLSVTGASIGTAATPGVGIVILASILQTFQIPVEGIALIFGVDRFLDMCRTSVNLSGDLVASVIIDRWSRQSK